MTAIIHATRLRAPSLFSGTRTMPTDSVTSWIITAVLGCVAFISHLVGVGTITDYGTPIFDEKHYVPQAWQVLTSGRWVEDNPTFGLVVHPPVGKWLIAFGEWCFGYTPLGWRIASVISGTILVIVIIRLARRISRSTIVGAIAGFLALVDGVIFLASRTALLDIFLITFVMLGLSFLMVDRDQVRSRLLAWREDAKPSREHLLYGPRVGFRWWRIAAGVAFGLGCGVKWSGVYFMVVSVGISLVCDVQSRKFVGIYQPWKATLRRDGLWCCLSLLVLPCLIYLATWCFWFASETSYDRYVNFSTADKADAFIKNPDNPLNFFPALKSWWYYQIDEVLAFHTNLTTHKVASPHPWESKPWSWPMGLRPVLYYFQTSNECQGCSGRILLEGTPTLWWASVPAFALIAWRSIIQRKFSYTIVLLGYLTAFLPWYSNIDRQMYYFYAIAMAPFLIIGIALIIGDFIGASQQLSPLSRLSGRGRLILATAYLTATAAAFLWLLPIFTGMQLSPLGTQLRIWLPSWG